jgi:DNA-binding beta-propeller fold protein YncE
MRSSRDERTRSVRGRPAGTFAFLLAVCGATLGTSVGAAAQDADLLYVCVQDEARIAVIDSETHQVIRTIALTELGFTANARPHHVAVEPDGQHWYVSLIGENRVVKFDRGGEMVGQFTMETPGMLAFDSAQDLLVASRSMTAVNPPARISVIRGGSMEGDEIDVFFPRPHPMVISAEGRWAYTGSLGVNQLAAIDLETEEVTLTTIEGPAHSLVQFALSPDGNSLVASTELTGRLLVFDRTDPARPRQIASIEVGPMAYDPVFAPDGRTVWVPVKGTNQVVVVDATQWQVVLRIEGNGLRQPHAVLFSSDGRWAFVSNNNKADHMAVPGHEAHAEQADGTGNVTVIDVAGHAVVKVIDLGKNVTGMGMRGAH